VPVPIAESVFTSERFLNIAHRGGARLAPEHTLVAYENGLAVGADVIELDLHATSDGVIVAIHDETVDRTTDGQGAVRQMTFAQLRQFDAGYRFTRDGGQTFPWRGKGLKVPTLDEALELLGDTPLSVEFKARGSSVVNTALASFRRSRGFHDIVFAAFVSEPIDQVRRMEPGALTAFTGRELAEFSLLPVEGLADYVPPARFVQPPKELVDAEFVERIHRVGLKVHPWTVNDRTEMCRQRQFGVDGMFTDDPATLHEVAQNPTCAPPHRD